MATTHVGRYETRWVPKCVRAIRARGSCTVPAMAYWYNVATGKVETDDQRSASNDLLGPFDTLHDAENALATSRTHRRSADAADAEWNQDADE